MTKEEILKRVKKFQGANREFSQELPPIIESLIDLIDEAGPEVVDNLESNDPDKALSANMGKELNVSKMDAPSVTGEAGQILQLDEEGNPEWVEAAAVGATYDSAVSDTSTNAIQNKTIKKYVDQLGQEIYDGKFPGVAIPVEFIDYSFYRADLTIGSSENYERAKIDVSAFQIIVFRAGIASTAAIVLTDQNDVILFTIDASTITQGDNYIDLTNYPGAFYLYFSNNKTIESNPFIKGAENGNNYAIPKLRKDIDATANPVTETDITDKTPFDLGHFYRQNLYLDSAANWIAALLYLDTTNYSGISLDAKPRSGGYVSLTDANDAILWQTNDKELFPMTILFADYPTAAKLYITSSPSESSTPRYPTIKYLMQKSLAERFTEIDEQLAVLGDAGETFEKEFLPNSFAPGNILQIPSEFGAFDIPVNISRTGSGIYGWDINPSRMRVPCSSVKKATYFVSTSGNDGFDGLTKSSALKTLDAALAKSDANTIIVLGGTYESGVHFSGGLTIHQSVNIIGFGNVVLRSADNDNPLKITNSVYIENIVFFGGLSALLTELSEETCVFVRCKFLNSGDSNGLTAKGGRYILSQCEASGNMMDGFNYHSNVVDNVRYYPQALEINCYGLNNGLLDNGYINNGSTMHENGGKIIRIYCEYGLSKGVVVADADGAKALNLAVVGHSSQNLDGADNRKACFGSQGYGTQVWLYDCEAFGGKYDVTIDADCVIYTTKHYPNELVNGTIEIIEINP